MGQRFSEFDIGDSVYILRSSIGLDLDSHSIFFYSKVVDKKEVARGNKYKISFTDGTHSKWLDKYLLYKDVGVLIINIGDYDTEFSLLDPLQDIVTSYFKLLIAGDDVCSVKIRTMDELGSIWKRYHAKVSHVVFIGHGSIGGIKFGDLGMMGASVITDVLEKESDQNTPAKYFMSLCCHSGRQEFGKLFSKSRLCKQFLGPLDTVMGAHAALYCQNFFTSSLMNNDTMPQALRDSNEIFSFMPDFESWMFGSPSLKYRLVSKGHSINEVENT